MAYDAARATASTSPSTFNPTTTISVIDTLDPTAKPRVIKLPGTRRAQRRGRPDPGRRRLPSTSRSTSPARWCGSTRTRASVVHGGPAGWPSRRRCASAPAPGWDADSLYVTSFRGTVTSLRASTRGSDRCAVRVTRSGRAPPGRARARRPRRCRRPRGTRRGCARCWRGTPAGCAGRSVSSCRSCSIRRLVRQQCAQFRNSACARSSTRRRSPPGEITYALWRDGQAAEVADVLADGERAVDVLAGQGARLEAVVLRDQRLRLHLEGRLVVGGPPVVEVAVAVVLRALVVEAVADLVADDRADAAVVLGRVGVGREERRLQDRRPGSRSRWCRGCSRR